MNNTLSKLHKRLRLVAQLENAKKAIKAPQFTLRTAQA